MLFVLFVNFFVLSVSRKQKFRTFASQQKHKIPFFLVAHYAFASSAYLQQKMT